VRAPGAVLALALAVGVAPVRAAPEGSGAEASVPWQVEPYWRPVLGFSTFASSAGVSTGARLGATGGVHYWKAPLLGRTRVLGAYTTGSSLSGLDLRLGSFMGPQWKLAGVEAGVDVFWDRYTAAGAEVMPASAGVDLPLAVQVGPESFYGMAGVTPAILFAPERRVDWSSTDAFGFGHEFGWQLGVGARLGRVGANLLYSRRIVASGVYSGWGVSLNL
jgi:hypothetical protein